MMSLHTPSAFDERSGEPLFAPVRCKKRIGTLPNLPRYASDPATGALQIACPAIDEGWTRWVRRIDYYAIPQFKIRSQIPFRTRRTIRYDAGNLRAAYDTIIIPDQPRAAILNGHRAGTMPPEYTGGLGAEGVKALREFVEQGGTLVCLNRASDFAIEQFKLPVRDVVDGLPRTDFYVPGSILRIELDTSDPIAKGMPKESIAWVENSPVFEVYLLGARASRPH